MKVSDGEAHVAAVVAIVREGRAALTPFGRAIPGSTAHLVSVIENETRENIETAYYAD